MIGIIEIIQVLGNMYKIPLSSDLFRLKEVESLFIRLYQTWHVADLHYLYVLNMGPELHCTLKVRFYQRIKQKITLLPAFKH